MRRLFTVAAVSLSIAVSIGCSHGDRAQPAPSAPAPSAPAASDKAPAGTLALGERITSPVVPLADVAKDPARFQDHVFATTGKITAVCQEMGCWMQLEDTTGSAHVRMHGHTFFVPKTAPGHVARVQGTLVQAGGRRYRLRRGQVGEAAVRRDRRRDRLIPVPGAAPHARRGRRPFLALGLGPGWLRRRRGMAEADSLRTPAERRSSLYRPRARNGHPPRRALRDASGAR